MRVIVVLLALCWQEQAKNHVADMESLKTSIYVYTKSFVRSMSHKIIRQDQVHPEHGIAPAKCQKVHAARIC